MLRFDAQILMHHWSMVRQVDGNAGFLRGGAQVLSGRRNGDMRTHLACVNCAKVLKGTSVPRRLVTGMSAKRLTRSNAGLGAIPRCASRRKKATVQNQKRRRAGVFAYPSNTNR